MTIRERIEAGEYTNRLPHRHERVPGHDDMTLRQARKHADEQDRLCREVRRKYSEEQARLTQKLREDLEREHGVVGHPKADKLWEMAWERGHSSGYPEVVYHYEDLAELVVQ